MNEATTTGDNSILSVIDSSKGSASTSVESANNTELVERLTRQLRDLESENLELGRAIPHLRDYKGEDCTKFVTGKLNELEEQKGKYRRAVDRLAELNKQFQHFKDDAKERAQESDRKLDELRNIANALENENTMLRDQLRNEESINYHLRENRTGSPRSFEECLQHIDQNSDCESGDLRSRQSTARTERPDSVREQALGQLVCALFDKLRTTADVFAQIHSGIAGEDAQNSEQIKLVEKIKNLKLDLNRSIELYNKKFQELQMSAPSSMENLNHSEVGPSNIKSCSRCKNIEEERDTLKAQLNREILLKNECLASRDELDKSFREARRSIEEMRSALLLSNNKIEDLQNKLQRNEHYYQTKYGGAREPEVIDLQEQINVLRKRNLELDDKNEQILRASQRYKELNREECDNKDIEIQQLQTTLENNERNIEHLQERCRLLETENKNSLELKEQWRRKDIMLRKYERKISNLREILSNYGSYFDQTTNYEVVVERCYALLEEKIVEGQRSTSSAASIPNN
ncbi:hypothetical protein ACQ4LE_006503 [Meloidogyne hapla]|uniref:GRIP domain-containing protein n=1 Tax=Meloidogyne hapla TaxID=6305 RepID=A0A1I8BHW7_MELHA